MKAMWPAAGLIKLIGLMPIVVRPSGALLMMTGCGKKPNAHASSGWMKPR